MQGIGYMEEKNVLAYSDRIRNIFEDQFTVSSFEKKIDADSHDSEQTISSAKKIVQDTFNKQDKKKYNVNLSDEIRDALENGEVEFVQGKNGDVYAQLRNSNGKFGKKLSITEELEDAGITFESLKIAVQMEAIAEQLKEVTSTLKEIETQISEAAIDRRNDRIGLFYSGMSLYMEASQVSDDTFRKHLMAQALKAISDANSQLIQDIRASIEFLSTEQYKRRKKPLELIEENLNAIKQCYEIVYKATMMKALIYHEAHELVAMATAISEYGEFIEKMIAPYTGLLSELDKNSKFISAGPWGRIASTQLNCDAIKNRLCVNDKLVIEMEDSNG